MHASATPEVSLNPNPVSLTGLSPWILGIKAKIGGRIIGNLQANTDGLDRYLECVEIAELTGAYLCCAFYQSDMNEAFTRMGLFMGAGKGMAASTLARNDDFVLANYRKLVAGHNLPSTMIRDFYQRLEKEKDASLQATPWESAFQKNFVDSPAVKAKGDRFYVIGLAIQNMKSYANVVTHEIFHARYFLDPVYSETVNRFWRESVTAADRKNITDVVGQAYNVDQEELVIDEFQAYLLQSEAEKDRMKNFVASYRQKLERTLASAGVRSIKCDLE